MRLNEAAKALLTNAGITQAAYARSQGHTDGRWRGDACGCPDDRCAGFHHSTEQPCCCLPVILSGLLSKAEYRVNYVIQRRLPGEPDYKDAGFGSTGGWNRLAAAAYEMQSNIDHQQWETTAGMPDPLTTRPGEDG